MPRKSKRILITSEHREVVSVRRMGHEVLYAYCSNCQAAAEFLTLHKAIHKSGKLARQILKLLESNDIHSIKIPSGHILVCHNSLKEQQ